MNISYTDGRRELLFGLNPEQAAEHVARATSDPAFERAEIMRQKDIDMETNGENNRHGRRKAAAMRRKHKRS